MDFVVCERSNWHWAEYEKRVRLVELIEAAAFEERGESILDKRVMSLDTLPSKVWRRGNRTISHQS